MAKESSANHPLRPVCEQWLQKIEIAQKYKQDRFGKYADEAAKFFDGPHNFMWDNDYAAPSGGGGFLQRGAAGDMMPTFRMTVNKPFEAVALFGPAMYHQNPNVQVSRDIEPLVDPMALGLDDGTQESMLLWQQFQQQMDNDRRVDTTVASVLQTYSNWLQREGDKKTQARRTICEAIVKGCSLMLTGVRVPAGSQMRIPVSRYKSIDDLQVDPDAEYWEDVQWVAIRCVHPVNLVEEEYGLPAGSLKGAIQSGNAQGNTSGSPRERTERQRREAQDRKNGRTHDLIEYWKIYSKNGAGDHLAQTSKNNLVYSKFDLTQLGKFAYLVVAKGVPYPLNLPSFALDQPPDALFQAAQWPIPYWADENSDGGWPFSRLFFFDRPNSVWPVSMFKPVIGELRFVNWCMSFLADKTAASCTTYVGVVKAAAAAIQKQFNPDSLHVPYKVIEIASDLGRSVNDLVSFIQAPNFPADIWRMVSEVMEQIDKRTGLTELVYGLSSRQLRSAREADVKEQSISIRPDDMASQTENFLSCVAGKELQAAQWSCAPEDVVGPLGPVAAKVWADHISTRELDQLFRDFKVRVEAGSSRKPNKGVRIDNLNQLGQAIMPAVQEMAMAGNVGPWNAYISEMARALDIDAAAFLLQPPPPPEQQGPSPEEIKAQFDQQRLQMQIMSKNVDILMKQQSHRQDLIQDQEVHDQEMEQLKERGGIELAAAKARAKASAKPSKNGNGRATK